MKNLSLLILTALIGLSCTTMSKQECEEGDWNRRGFEDATHGVSRDTLKRHAKACKDHGFPVDVELYERGYDKGLESFCTYKRGFQYGLDGRSYYDTCPKDLEPEFYKGYTMGMQQRKLDKAAKRAEDEASRDDDDDDDI